MRLRAQSLAGVVLTVRAVHSRLASSNMAGGERTELACRTLPHSAAQIYGRQTFLSMMLLLSSELPKWLDLATSHSQCTDE